MTATAVGSRPQDQLLAWLSARGRASRATVDRACVAIAARFEAGNGGTRSPLYRYVEPLRRIGHVEWVRGGFAVVPTTLCWTRRSGLGVFIGSRDGLLKDELYRRLGSRFVVSDLDGPWPQSWDVSGDREAVVLEGLGVDVVDEPGMRLLGSLPTLEVAIAAWSDAGRPSGNIAWGVLYDPGRGRWRPAGEMLFEEGLVRPVGGRGRRRGWLIVRSGLDRALDSPERRAVAWWAELARLARPRIVFDRAAGRLVLPACPLPPPAMVERPLIWASGSPPVRDSRKRLVYEAIDSERANEVARVLGLTLEEAL